MQWDYVPSPVINESLSVSPTAASGTAKLNPFNKLRLRNLVAKTSVAAPATTSIVLRVLKNGSVIDTKTLLPADGVAAKTFAVSQTVVKGDDFQLQAESVGAFASLITALTNPESNLSFTAVAEGTAGNAVTVAYVVAGNSTPLTIGVVGDAITVNVATDAGGLPTSTAADVLAALQGTPAAVALMTPALKTGEDGSGVVEALVATNLAGGVNGVSSTVLLALTAEVMDDHERI